ncbi:ABC transporter ATP-binding protein [Xanthobacter tagetidis]|jgi:NitT/TauT family transport system ATP-binding protein|uniref:ABC transporter ATP-binding protein n=1 Tax=Xanthobacter tagetidis TaxID=60216 RepID=A0A3L7AK07_9HYPH|nr:ABC transporter ATP-binding protein [Xanthobacter tagetidis]MBB6309169.1 NitT/TauT family transport system ATP-binding protein [Xanthobacter tagetidis]RLP80354.1 ABC transporter ATP-binding protein [Xanthobacter tagetidis]
MASLMERATSAPQTPGESPAACAPPRVKVVGVSKTFPTPDGGVARVIENVDLTLAEGEFLSIVGPSGCGKSTMLRLISGLTPVSEGRIVVAGREVTEPPPGVGFMFQRDTLLPWATVSENISIALELNGTPPAARPARIAELLKLLGLERYADYRPSAISGGMRQRAALGRLLAYGPELYLMDEPFGALDAMTKMILGRELLRIWSQDAKSVVFVTHDIEEAVGLSDRVIVMEGPPGRIKSEYRIDLPRPRDFRAVRLLPEFRDLCERIWGDIGRHSEAE